MKENELLRLVINCDVKDKTVKLLIACSSGNLAWKAKQIRPIFPLFLPISKVKSPY